MYILYDYETGKVYGYGSIADMRKLRDSKQSRSLLVGTPEGIYLDLPVKSLNMVESLFDIAEAESSTVECDLSFYFHLGTLIRGILYENMYEGVYWDRYWALFG